VFPRPPERDALFDKAIEFAQCPSADATEVVPSTPDVRIELSSEAGETPARHTCLLPQFVANASLRLWGDIEIQSLEPPPMRVPEKDESRASRIEHPRLVRMQGQSESRHDALNPRQLAVGPLRVEQHKIIGVPDESATQGAVLHEAAEVAVE
jgi:hypothetical protein